MKPRFCLPVILNQPDYKRAETVAYCPQDVSLFRPPRLVDNQVSYCPQDVSLFRPDRTVNANVAYCPQDVAMLRDIAYSSLWQPTGSSLDLWLKTPTNFPSEPYGNFFSLININQISQWIDLSASGLNFTGNYLDDSQNNFIRLRPTFVSPTIGEVSLQYNLAPDLTINNKPYVLIDNNITANSFYDTLNQLTYFEANNNNFFTNVNQFHLFIVFNSSITNPILDNYFNPPAENRIYHVQKASLLSCFDATKPIFDLSLEGFANDTYSLKLDVNQNNVLTNVFSQNGNFSVYNHRPNSSTTELTQVITTTTSQLLSISVTLPSVLTNTTHNNIFLGTNQNLLKQFYGMIGEIIIKKGTLATLDKQKIEGYLAYKWNLQNKLSNDHPYKGVPPLV